MPLGYLIKINKLQQNSQPCVVRKTQNTSFGVVDLHQLRTSIRRDQQIVKHHPNPYAALVSLWLSA
jgi:hypothetical protein